MDTTELQLLQLLWCSSWTFHGWRCTMVMLCFILKCQRENYVTQISRALPIIIEVTQCKASLESENVLTWNVLNSSVSCVNWCKFQSVTQHQQFGLPSPTSAKRLLEYMPLSSPIIFMSRRFPLCRCFLPGETEVEPTRRFTVTLWWVLCSPPSIQLRVCSQWVWWHRSLMSSSHPPPGHHWLFLIPTHRLTFAFVCSHTVFVQAPRSDWYDHDTTTIALWLDTVTDWYQTKWTCYNLYIFSGREKEIEIERERERERERWANQIRIN